MLAGLIAPRPTRSSVLLERGVEAGVIPHRVNVEFVAE
jgi:hypothetical protein